MRRPAPGAQNWAGSEFLDLMGFAVGVESRTVERPFYRLVPRQVDVVEIYDQPYHLRLRVLRRDGKVLPPHDHTPDALCIRTNRVHFTECKPWERLVAIQEKYPDKYCLGKDGRWRSSAAERALEGTGIGYEIFTDRDINPTLLRNVNFLTDFERESPPDAAIFSSLRASLTAQPIQTLERLFALGVDRRTVYLAIARGVIHFDLNRDLVSNERAPVYLDEVAWDADRIVQSTAPSRTIAEPMFCPEPGAQLKYCGDTAEVVSADATGLWIRTRDGTCANIAAKDLMPLISAGRLQWERANQPLVSFARAQIAAASAERLARAIKARRTIEPWLNGERKGGTTRTIRRRLRIYRMAEAVFGNGLVGLLDQQKRRGNRTNRLSLHQEQVIGSVIQSDYLDAARSIDATLARINVTLESTGEFRIGRKALCRRIEQIPAEDREDRRHGKRMANAARAPHNPTTQPAKGERAFEVAMIDSFSVPMKAHSRRTELIIDAPLWATILWNCQPPYPLGLALQFSKPSTRSVILALRDCVRRHNRLPDNIYYDKGSENQSLTLDLLHNQYKVNFLKHPPDNPRFGTDVEVSIGFFKRMIREYQGSYKQIPRRGGTTSHSPQARSKWYFDDFEADLRKLLFDDWPEMEHGGLAATPKQVWLKSLADQGDRPMRYIPYDDNFVVISTPIAKAAAKIIPTRGIRHEYVWYYSDALDDPRLANKLATIREPIDDSYILVQVHDKWVRCDAVSYVFRLFTHREQRFLLEEWKAESRQSNSRERLTPEAYERFVCRVAKEEERFAATRKRPKNTATVQHVAAPLPTQTIHEEKVDDFVFRPDPIL